MATTPTESKIKQFLKSHGHKATEVDNEKYITKDDKIKSICKLHSVTELEYQAGKK